MGKKPESKVSGNVLPITRAAAENIEPPNDWQIESPNGFMAIDGTPGGRLVLLSDGLLHLKKSRSLPDSVALDVLCESLTPQLLESLFLVSVGEYAARVSMDALQYRKPPPLHHVVAGVGGDGRGSVYGPLHEGLDGLVESVRAAWKNFARSIERARKRGRSPFAWVNGRHCAPVNRLAVPFGVAHALWGWGVAASASHAVDATFKEPATWAELLAFRLASEVKPAWTPAQRRIVSDEKDRRMSAPGAVGVAKAMAEELGVTVALLNSVIRHLDQVGKREVARKSRG